MAGIILALVFGLKRKKAFATAAEGPRPSVEREDRGESQSNLKEQSPIQMNN